MHFHQILLIIQIAFVHFILPNRETALLNIVIFPMLSQLRWLSICGHILKLFFNWYWQTESAALLCLILLCTRLIMHFLHQLNI